MAFWKGAGSRSGEELFREIVDSAGPMVMVFNTEGIFLHVNPAAERLLGYHASELLGKHYSTEILGHGESGHLTEELLQLVGKKLPPGLAVTDRLRAAIQAVGGLPPSQVPGFETHCRRKDGSSFAVYAHASALRSPEGKLLGMVVLAIDQTAPLRQQRAARESQERYRDLFESSQEMIATLSPGGQFHYANPAWKQAFGLEPETLLALASFEMVFSPECRAEAAAHFQHALNGGVVERVPLRHVTDDGQVMELELSLSRRQKVGNPLAVRCLLRNVTQQKQREHRLALQLAVSQIVGESASAEAAVERILEAVATTHGWDFGVLWEVDESLGRLAFFSAWAVPGLRTETLMRQSLGAQLEAGDELAGSAWAKGRALWTRNLAEADPQPGLHASSVLDARIERAAWHGMVSGLAVPVRAGSRIVAVLELLSRRRVSEDGEALASVETVAASLGQMLARKRERGRADELSRQQEVLLNAVADGICGLDRCGKITFANPAAGHLFGLKTGAQIASLEGQSLHELFHPHSLSDPEDKCGPECPLRRDLEGTEARSGETTISSGGGNELPVEYGLTPLFERSRFSGFVLSFRDISQRYALDRMKDEFVSTAGHELRTPLTSIRGALGLLSSGALGKMDEKAENLLRIALNNSERLIRLVNDILDIERIQHVGGPDTFKPVQLAEVIAEAVRGLRPVADAAGVPIIHDTARATVDGDADRLLQVMTNLIANAVKFSPAGSTVSVMTRPEQDGATISVIDQGRGIPSEMLESIFGRFTQVDASDARQKGGSGLGLAISRTIVNQHGGRIWAERNPVRGSTFRVYLPYGGKHAGPAPHSETHENDIVAAQPQITDN